MDDYGQRKSRKGTKSRGGSKSNRNTGGVTYVKQIPKFLQEYYNKQAYDESAENEQVDEKKEVPIEANKPNIEQEKIEESGQIKFRKPNKRPSTDTSAENTKKKSVNRSTLSFGD
eukprot:GHVL01031769.1.p2 GENE.GHVL01031769.1~~GHVL01031769.1.p2  ORF type:complete len:115 (+),score=19.54 GHVL01031769.1:43-387(+)